MPKKKPATPADHSEKFVEGAQKLIDAVEINPPEADKAMGQLVAAQRIPTTASAGHDD